MAIKDSSADITCPALPSGVFFGPLRADVNGPESNAREVRVSAFETTRWTLVLRASGSDDDASQAALAALCRAYWLPLYV